MILIPFGDDTLPEVVVRLKWVAVIRPIAGILQLSFQWDSILGHRPDILGVAGSIPWADHAPLDPEAQQSQRFRSPKQADFIAEGLVISWQRGRSQPEVTGIPLVVWFPAITHLRSQPFQRFRCWKAAGKTPFAVKLGAGSGHQCLELYNGRCAASIRLFGGNLHLAHVDLARRRGGNEGGAVFGEAVDCRLHLLGQCFELCGLGI